MAGLLGRAFKLVFDFRRDVADLSEELRAAEKNTLRLIEEATRLHDEIERLRRENQELKNRNRDLQQALDERD